MLRSTAVIAGGAVSLVRFNARLASRARVLAWLVGCLLLPLVGSNTQQSLGFGWTHCLEGIEEGAWKLCRTKFNSEANKQDDSQQLRTDDASRRRPCRRLQAHAQRALPASERSSPWLLLCCAALHCAALIAKLTRERVSRRAPSSRTSSMKEGERRWGKMAEQLLSTLFDTRTRQSKRTERDSKLGHNSEQWLRIRTII